VVGVDGFSGSYQPEKTLMEGSPMEVKAMAQALLNFIADDECSEVLMNGPKEISRKIGGTRFQCPEINFSDAATYHQVINEVVLRYCADTDDRIDGKTVMIEGQLELPSPISNRAPMLARVHIIAPPGVSFAKVTIAKKPRVDLTLDDLAENGTLSQNEADFLKACARGRKTIVVSGATGSGKTTLLQSITHHFDSNDRVIVIEETPELRLPFGDVVYLRATPERPGQDPEDIYDLAFWTKQSNRMRMDRVIVGEIRGAEMSEWLMAANSGAEGSATTVHANTPRRCLDKILGLATKSLTSTSEGQLRREIASTIDLIVQVGVVDGRHIVTEIEEISDTVAQQSGQIMTNTIFSYDKAKGMHVSMGRPSDDFIESLESQGIAVNSAWFRN
jgi:pilus assembly protein CpaF